LNLHLYLQLLQKDSLLHLHLQLHHHHLKLHLDVKHLLQNLVLDLLEEYYRHLLHLEEEHIYLHHHLNLQLHLHFYNLRHHQLML
tara:strand:- start:176 stop:430 length:255 start_codon:yes stop_codon:yes gene_type:complete